MEQCKRERGTLKLKKNQKSHDYKFNISLLPPVTREDIMG